MNNKDYKPNPFYKSRIEKFDVSIERVKIYEVRNGSDWAKCTVQEWPYGGMVAILSSHGNYNGMWNSIDENIRSFLWSCDYDYFMNKTRKALTGFGPGKEFSALETIRLMKQRCMEKRFHHELTIGEARRAWNDIEEYVYDGMDLDELYSTFQASDAWRLLYNGDITDLVIGDEDIPECRYFWENQWKILIEMFYREEQETSLLKMQIEEARRSNTGVIIKHGGKDVEDR